LCALIDFPRNFFRQFLAATHGEFLRRYCCSTGAPIRSGIVKTMEVQKMKKALSAVVLALCLVPAAAFAQVGIVVRVAPPAPIVEHYGPAPRPGWVWIAGMAGATSGCPDTGPHRRIPTLSGFLIAGNIVMADGLWLKATGVNLPVAKEEAGHAPRFLFA